MYVPVDVEVVRHATATQCNKVVTPEYALDYVMHMGLPEETFQKIQKEVEQKIQKKENYQGFITGSGGHSAFDPLSDDKGKPEARKFGKDLFVIHPDLTEIYTSKLKRCIQTAKLAKKGFIEAAKEQNPELDIEELKKRIKITKVEGLEEINHGKNDGYIPSSVRKIIYEVFYSHKIQEAESSLDSDIKHKQNPPQFKDGETYREAGLRFKAALIKIAEDTAQNGKSYAVAISSSAVIKSLYIDVIHKQSPCDIKPMFYEEVGKYGQLVGNMEVTTFRAKVTNAEDKTETIFELPN